jgi:tryptophan synthase beta chain
VTVSDQEAREAFEWTSRSQGIVPAMESAHALAHARSLAAGMNPGTLILVNCSGRGDKDAVRFALRELVA